jgi:hypothetical protein
MSELSEDAFRHQQPEEPKLEIPTGRPDHTFHWPAGCSWAFMENGSDSEKWERA